MIRNIDNEVRRERVVGAHHAPLQAHGGHRGGQSATSRCGSCFKCHLYWLGRQSGFWLVPYSRLWTSENSFAICFLLEIPLRGFPFRMKLSWKYRIPEHSINLICQRISCEKEIPSGGSQAGNLSQTSRPRWCRSSWAFFGFALVNHAHNI